jgi:hypothetical protein
LACPGADLSITLQHCLQTKTRQIARYNVDGLGQGLQISARPGATPRWDAQQRINQVWARDCGIWIADFIKLKGCFLLILTLV